MGQRPVRCPESRRPPRQCHSVAPDDREAEDGVESALELLRAGADNGAHQRGSRRCMAWTSARRPKLREIRHIVHRLVLRDAPDRRTFSHLPLSHCDPMDSDVILDAIYY